MNETNASDVNVNAEAGFLYMRVNSHVICKMKSDIFCSGRE